MQVVQLVHMLKEYPYRSQSSSIQELHQGFHAKLGIALIILKRNRADIWEFLEHIPTVIMGRHTPKKHSRFLSKSCRDEDEVLIGQGCEWDSLLGTKVLIGLLGGPSSTVNFTAWIFTVPGKSHLFLPFEIFYIVDLLLFEIEDYISHVGKEIDYGLHYKSLHWMQIHFELRSILSSIGLLFIGAFPLLRTGLRHFQTLAYLVDPELQSQVQSSERFLL